MTPKQKAEEIYRKCEKLILTGKYHVNGFVIPEMSKGCALIAVNEIINEIKDSRAYQRVGYWKDVKAIIQNL